MFIKYRRICTVDAGVDLDVTVDVQLLCMQDIQIDNFCTTTATFYGGQLYIFQYFGVYLWIIFVILAMQLKLDFTLFWSRIFW